MPAWPGEHQNMHRLRETPKKNGSSHWLPIELRWLIHVNTSYYILLHVNILSQYMLIHLYYMAMENGKSSNPEILPIEPGPFHSGIVKKCV